MTSLSETNGQPLKVFFTVDTEECIRSPPHGDAIDYGKILTVTFTGRVATRDARAELSTGDIAKIWLKGFIFRRTILRICPPDVGLEPLRRIIREIQAAGQRGADCTCIRNGLPELPPETLLARWRNENQPC